MKLRATELLAKLFGAALATLISVTAFAQPSPTPSPWIISGSTISYNKGGVVVGPATGGSKGAGTINLSNGVYYNGVLLTPGGGGGLTFQAATPLSVSTVGATTAYSCPNCGVTTGPLSQFAATTSAQLRGVLSDETGTGAAVFGTSPTIATPTISSPAISAPTITGSFTATGLVKNSDLVNAATTVNGVSCTLGSPCTITASTSVIVGTTPVTSGTTGRVIFDNAGVIGEYPITGSAGNVVMSGAPTISGLVVTGSFSATGLVTNADLANSSTTVNGQVCALGSTCSISAAASMVVGSSTISGGTTTRVLFDNAGVLGEYAITGTGNVVLSASPTFTGTIAAAAAAFTSSGASAVAVGPNGATNPSFVVDASAGSAVAGLKVKGAATGGTVAMSVIDTGSNASLSINAKGGGTISIGSVSTGGILLSSPTIVGVNTTPPTGVLLQVSNNVSSLAPMNGFTAPELLIGGADGARGIIAIQTYATGSEPSFLGFGAQGTRASPLSTVSGQNLVEFFGHGFTTLGSTPGFQHDSGGGFIVTATQNYTDTAQGSAVNVYTTVNGTAVAALAASFGNDGSLFTSNSINIGAASPASGTVRGLGINGAAAGSGAGTSLTGNDGGSIVWSIGSYSALFGGSYDGRLALYSQSLGVVTNSSFKSLSSSGGIGYGTGAGGAVTQASSRSTGVTLNTVSGAITLVSAAGTNSYNTFTVTNSSVAATDIVVPTQKSGTDKYFIFVSRTAAGAFDITFNDQTGTTVEQPVFNFVIIKGVNN